MPNKTKSSNLLNKKFGLLSVVKVYVNEKWHRTYCECNCECGTKNHHLAATLLLRGLQESCGCKKRGKGNKSHAWNGYEDIPGSSWSRIKICAKKRKILFDLDIQCAWEIFIRQNRCCALSGVPLKFESNFRNLNGTASLDRIDSTKGYIDGNVQWVHKDVNMMKQTYSQEKFFNWCQKITTFNLTKKNHLLK